MGALLEEDKEEGDGCTARLLHRDSAIARVSVHGEMESEKRCAENHPYSIDPRTGSVELPGGGGEGSHSGAGSHGRDTEFGGRSGANADHGIGGASELAKLFFKEAGTDTKSSREEIQEGSEGSIGSINFVWNAERVEEDDQQCQDQEKVTGMDCFNTDVDGSGTLLSHN
jgi:hypothetical protein